MRYGTCRSRISRPSFLLNDWEDASRTKLQTRLHPLKVYLNVSRSATVLINSLTCSASQISAKQNPFLNPDTIYVTQYAYHDFSSNHCAIVQISSCREPHSQKSTLPDTKSLNTFLEYKVSTLFEPQIHDSISSGPWHDYSIYEVVHALPPPSDTHPPSPQFDARTKSTLSALTSDPPMQVLVNGLSPHVALAAATHASHLPFVISIVCPAVAAVSVNLAVPDVPVVVAGLPAHCSMVPAMPPQMSRRATLMSCETRVVPGAVQTVEPATTAAGFTTRSSRFPTGRASNGCRLPRGRTSNSLFPKSSSGDRLARFVNAWAEPWRVGKATAAVARRRDKKVEECILEAE